MKTINGRALFAILSLALLSACSSSTGPVSKKVSSAPQLFSLEPTQDRKTLQRTAQGYLATLLADPASAEVTFIKIDPALVSKQTHDLAVTLPDGKTAQFHLREYNTITPGIEGWVGVKPSAWKQTHPSSASEIDNDPFFHLSLARDGEKVVGSMVVDGQAYWVQYVSTGEHVLIKVDESKLPPDGKPVESAEVVARDDSTGNKPQSAISVIRLLFVTTNQVRATRPNNRAELANAVNVANDYMKNSDVAIRFEVAGFYDADYDQPSGYWQQAEDMKRNQQLAQRRDALMADLVTIYSTNPQLCGQATLKVNKANAFGIISCLGSLGHELGHNLGALHHNGESGNVEKYAFGYKDEVGRFHTQMRTSHGAVPYFSNPRLSYHGRPLGDADLNDVAKAFNERRETVENFYPPFPVGGGKIVNKKRHDQGLPACLQLSTDGVLRFSDCVANPSPQQQWSKVSVTNGVEKDAGRNGDEKIAVKNRYSTVVDDPAACLGEFKDWDARLVDCAAMQTPTVKPVWKLEKLQDGYWKFKTSTLGVGKCLTAGVQNNYLFLNSCENDEPMQAFSWDVAP